MDHSDHESQATNASHDESLLDILKRRYASGEITLAQFEEMKRVLGVEQAIAPTAPSDTHPHR